MPDEQYADFSVGRHYWKALCESVRAFPAWVAVDGDRIVGLRVWLRWRFGRDGRSWEAVRAVDTATQPNYQRRGVSKRLTTSSLETLRRQAGVTQLVGTQR